MCTVMNKAIYSQNYIRTNQFYFGLICTNVIPPMSKNDSTAYTDLFHSQSVRYLNFKCINIEICYIFYIQISDL